MTKKEILLKTLKFRIAEIDESIIDLIEESMQIYADQQLILNGVVKSFYCKSESQGKKAKCDNECYECAFKRIES
jgi:hypothetical protein